MTSGFRACSKLPKNIELAKTEQGIQGTANASSALFPVVMVALLPLGTKLYLAVLLLFLLVIRCGNRRSNRCIPPKIQETSTCTLQHNSFMYPFRKRNKKSLLVKQLIL